MGELESREGVLQLDRGITCIGKVSSHEDFAHSSDALPHADGNFVDQHGTAWAADTSLMEAQLDISEMTDGWVRQTSDKLFRNLTTIERWLPPDDLPEGVQLGSDLSHAAMQHSDGPPTVQRCHEVPARARWRSGSDRRVVDSLPLLFGPGLYSAHSFWLTSAPAGEPLLSTGRPG